MSITHTPGFPPMGPPLCCTEERLCHGYVYATCYREVLPKEGQCGWCLRKAPEHVSLAQSKKWLRKGSGQRLERI